MTKPAKSLKIGLIYKMPKSHFHPFCFYYTLYLVLMLLFLLKGVQICKGFPILGVNSGKSGEIGAIVKRACVGKIGQCPDVEMEEEMDSESSRRILMMQKRYISYDTLRRDMVPCNKPGASYYNCQGHGVANTYTRGCEEITRCARGG